MALRHWRLWPWRLDVVLARRFGLATKEDRTFFVLIPLVGVVAGLLSVGIHKLIDGIRLILWGSTDLQQATAAAPAWLYIAAPATGGLLVGLLVWMGREKVAGGGMSVLIESVAQQGGRVPPRPVAMRALAAIATVGSGGSLGREGPMIRLGAMFSSQLGSRLGLPPQKVKILVGCGAAAGLAAAYNIPVGGALFVMEVILGNFALEIFGPIVIASIISTLIARAAEGNIPNYDMPAYSLQSGWEMLSFGTLGVVAALVSVAFIFAVREGGTLFGRLKLIPEPLRPALGLGLVGALALATDLPDVLGSGADTIGRALNGELPLVLLLSLPLAKVVATSLTRGSGGAGGLFTPSLMVGALVGGAFGSGVDALWPGLGSPAPVYAAVGMAGVAAGTSHAPISAILILFELTGNYGLILPLMVSAIVAGALSKRLYPFSSYTIGLADRGVDISLRMEEAALASLSVGDLLREDDDVLCRIDDYRVVVERFLVTRRERLFVVGDGGQLQGEISLHDIKHVLHEGHEIDGVLAFDLMQPAGQVLHRSERLHHAAEIFSHSDHERLPVVEDGSEADFCGYLAKRDLLSVYSQEVLGRPALLATFISSDESGSSRDYVELPPGFTVRAAAVPLDLDGKSLLEARLPQRAGAWVIGLEQRRDGRTRRVIPNRDTVLAKGDKMILLGRSATVEALERGHFRFPQAIEPEDPPGEPRD